LQPASKSPDVTEIILRDDSPAGDEPQEELADGNKTETHTFYPPGCVSDQVKSAFVFHRQQLII